MSFQGNNHFLTPLHVLINDYIQDWHLGLDSEVRSSLEDEYSVTQSLPGYYIVVKWWGAGLFLRALLSQKIQAKVLNPSFAPKGASLNFFFSGLFG